MASVKKGLPRDSPRMKKTENSKKLKHSKLHEKIEQVLSFSSDSETSPMKSGNGTSLLLNASINMNNGHVSSTKLKILQERSQRLLGNKKCKGTMGTGSKQSRCNEKKAPRKIAAKNFKGLSFDSDSDCEKENINHVNEDTRKNGVLFEVANDHKKLTYSFQNHVPVTDINGSGNDGMPLVTLNGVDITDFSENSLSMFQQRDHSLSTAYPEMSRFQKLVEDDSVEGVFPTLDDICIESTSPGSQAPVSVDPSGESFVSTVSTEGSMPVSDHMSSSEILSDDHNSMEDTDLSIPVKVSLSLQVSMAVSPKQDSDISTCNQTDGSTLFSPNCHNSSADCSPTETKNISLQVSMACSPYSTHSSPQTYPLGDCTTVSPEMRNMSIQASMVCSPECEKSVTSDTDQEPINSELEARNIYLPDSTAGSPEVRDISVQASMPCSPEAMVRPLETQNSDKFGEECFYKLKKAVSELETDSTDHADTSQMYVTCFDHTVHKYSGDNDNSCVSTVNHISEDTETITGTPKLCVKQSHSFHSSVQGSGASMDCGKHYEPDHTEQELFVTTAPENNSDSVFKGISPEAVPKFPYSINKQSNGVKRNGTRNNRGRNSGKSNKNSHVHEAMDFSSDSDTSPTVFFPKPCESSLSAEQMSHSQLQESVTNLSVRLQSILLKSEQSTKTRHTSGKKHNMKKTEETPRKKIGSKPTGCLQQKVENEINFSEIVCSQKQLPQPNSDNIHNGLSDSQQMSGVKAKAEDRFGKSSKCKKIYEVLDFSSDDDSSPDRGRPPASEIQQASSAHDSTSFDRQMLSMRLESVLSKSNGRGVGKSKTNHPKATKKKASNRAMDGKPPLVSKPSTTCVRASGRPGERHLSSGSISSESSSDPLRLPKRLSSFHDLDYTLAEGAQLPQCESTRLSEFSPDISDEHMDSTGNSSVEQTDSTQVEVEDIRAKNTGTSEQKPARYDQLNHSLSASKVERSPSYPADITPQPTGLKQTLMFVPSDITENPQGHKDSQTRDTPTPDEGCEYQKNNVESDSDDEYEGTTDGNMSLYVTVCEEPPGQDSDPESDDSPVGNSVKNRGKTKKVLRMSSSEDSDFEVGRPVSVGYAQRETDSDEEYNNGGSLTEFKGPVGGRRKTTRKAWKSEQTDDSDDNFLPDLSSEKQKSSSKSRLKGARAALGPSDDTDDDLDSFLTRIKTPAKTKPKKNESLEAFIVDDDDMTDSSSDDDDVYIVKHDRPILASVFPFPERRTSSVSDVIDVDDEDFKKPKSPAVKSKGILGGKHKLLTQTPGRYLPKPNHSSLVAVVRNSGTRSHSTGDLPQFHNFLRSLSQDVADDRRHPDSVRYVRNFKKHREDLTKKLFTTYNKSVFDNQLPHDFRIDWNSRLIKTAGFCAYKRTGNNRTARVELSVKVCDSPERVRDTLIHELCHAVVWLVHGVNDGHGRFWKHWAGKANRIHPDLPVILRCHSYEINHKYIYKCSSCGYQIGRHSKSLDTSKKVCGYCRSPFELLVNGKNGPVSTPKTPRTPNKFALFVKENYGSVKKQTPGIKHKDVMAVLSSEFSTKNRISESV